MYDFDNIAYLPGEQNFPADVCSRPPTNVYVLRATSSAPVTRVSYDTVDLATLFDACSHVQSPVEATICACVESTVNAEFLQRVRIAQQADSEMGDILQRLSLPTYDISQDQTQQLYSLEEGLLVVREIPRVRIVIPSGDLRIELLSIHHNSAGHPGKTVRYTLSNNISSGLIWLVM